jgi:predicted DNA-binding helix-hairpin-helix protein
VQRILSIRRYHKLQMQDLERLHVRLKLAMDYLVTPDHLPKETVSIEKTPTAAAQLNLFTATG